MSLERSSLASISQDIRARRSRTARLRFALVRLARQLFGGARGRGRQPTRRSPSGTDGAQGDRSCPGALRLTVALERAMRWEKAYRGRLSLPGLAERLGESRHRISEVLNSELGVGFHDYVNRYRVEDAARLLVDEPDRPVSEIASHVGFQSLPSFNRAFRKFTGETPTGYRARSHPDSKGSGAK